MTTTDRFPQIMTIESGDVGVDDFHVTTVSLPLNRMGVRRGFTMAMEILRVNWFLAVKDDSDVNQTKFGWLTSATTRVNDETSSLGAIQSELGRPRTFAAAGVDESIVTTGGHSLVMPLIRDLTDGMGNGFLYVGDTLTMVYGNVGGTATDATCIAKVLYRFVEVKSDELFGVLQSQQAVVS